jgi:GntR family transcriptional regulator/MocR family aminotransferase
MFPVNQWKNLTNLYWRHIKSSTLSYSPSSGIVPLKKSIAAYLNISRGLKCDFRQVVIVSGSLQSLYLLGNVLIDPGDGVVLENPTFPNVHSIFRSLRAHIHPVNIEAGGIQLPEAWGQKPSPKAIHTTPSHHYPSGVRMSLARRQALLAWAYRHLSFIIENDYEHEISNWHDPIPSLFSLDTQDRVIYLGTFNRLLHPSVRLGYMVVPFYLLPAVEALQKHSHRFVSPSLQIVMNQFIEKKYLYAHVKNVVGAAEERKALFEKLFEELFQGEMELVPREADSLYLLARFRRRMKDKDLVRMLEQGNIIAHAYSKCFIDGQPEDGLILGYASVRNPVIRKTLSQMHRLWREAGL